MICLLGSEGLQQKDAIIWRGIENVMPLGNVNILTVALSDHKVSARDYRVQYVVGYLQRRGIQSTVCHTLASLDFAHPTIVTSGHAERLLGTLPYPSKGDWLFLGASSVVLGSLVSIAERTKPAEPEFNLVTGFGLIDGLILPFFEQLERELHTALTAKLHPTTRIVGLEAHTAIIIASEMTILGSGAVHVNGRRYIAGTHLPLEIKK